MRYLQCGSGPALVLVHGIMGYSFSWTAVLESLGRHSTVYAVDLLGMGYSDVPHDVACTLEGTARRMLAFLKAVGVEEADLLGSSYGGAVATMTGAVSAESSSPRVRSLILAAPVSPWSEQRPRLGIVLFANALGEAMSGVLSRITPAYAPAIAILYGDPRRCTREVVAGYREALVRPGVMRTVARTIRSWKADVELLARTLPRLRRMPTLLIWGTRDRAVSPKSAEQLRHAFENAELVWMQGLGHIPYHEAPDQFAGIVNRYLQQVRAGRLAISGSDDRRERIESIIR